jgi:RimJ/RimL family protein N-acetyltransferase
VDALSLARFERALTMPGGELLRVRPIRPDDEPRLVALYDRLSRDSRYQRFFSVMRRLPPDWAHFLANVDHRSRFALVAEEAGATETRVIAVARYEGIDGTTAEVAFAVEDRWQGKGLGTLLIVDLLRAAALNGFTRYRAFVLADNHRMLGLLVRHTSVLERRAEQGVVELLLEAKT